jgi:membrane protein implicated in regulation of membrane protease activity
MSAKPEAIAQNNQSKWSQDYKDKLAFLKRHSMRVYLQYINPKLGALIEIFANPKQFYDDIKPSNIGLWLLIAAVLTAALVLLMPTIFWKLQPIFFLLIFFLGATVTRFFMRLKDSFKNLLVAYPGKHLLNQEIKVENPIENGTADIILDGKAWQVQGNDCPVGTRVRVIAINESVLFVRIPMRINE